MAGAREGQKAILVYMQDDFLLELDRRLAAMGYSDRSTFIREAIYEKMDRNGVTLLREVTTAPSRTGKGGRPASSQYKVKRPAKPREKKI